MLHPACPACHGFHRCTKGHAMAELFDPYNANRALTFRCTCGAHASGAGAAARRPVRA
jgi:hypothetical protein